MERNKITNAHCTWLTIVKEIEFSKKRFICRGGAIYYEHLKAGWTLA